MNKLPNIHPGEVLREEFLTPLNVTAYRLARSIGVPQTRVADIIHERRAITADTACRLAAFFGTTAEFWLGLQNLYDLELARENLSETLLSIPHVNSAV
jgi:addiction module HigA family antidote